MTEPRWLAPKELAAHIGVHVRTVRRWIAGREQAIEVMRVGGVVRVRLRVRACHSVAPAIEGQPRAH